MSRKIYGSTVRSGKPDTFGDLPPAAQVVALLLAGVAPLVLMFGTVALGWFGVGSGDADHSETIRRQVEACEYSRNHGGHGC